MRIAILCPDFPPDRSGLADHTALLAGQMAARADVVVITSQREVREKDVGRVVVLREVPRWGWRGAAVVRRLLNQLRPDWVLAQYVPHMYGRGGINFMLPLLLWWWRWRGGPVLLLLHELYIPWSLAPKRLVAAVAQRLMLIMNLAASRCVGISTEVWQRKLQRLFPFWSSRFFHLPTPSNVPVEPTSDSETGATRERLGLPADALILCFFGTLHDSKMMGYALESLRAVEAGGQSARLLCIGPTSEELTRLFKHGSGEFETGQDIGGGSRRGTPASSTEQNRGGHSGPPVQHSVCTGYVDAKCVSHYLAAADLFLLPLIDGVSSRRSSLMAALSHGLPVAATAGYGTGPLLHTSEALALSPIGDQAAFVANVQRLARSPLSRDELARRGRQLYEQHFSWPVVVENIFTHLTEHASERSTTH